LIVYGQLLITDKQIKMFDKISVQLADKYKIIFF